MYEKREYDFKNHPKISHGVIGLLNRGETDYLNQVASRLGSGIYADLGTYRGSSAITIADGIKTAGVNGIVFTFDTFDRRHLLRRNAKDRDDSPRNAVKAAILERNLDDYIEIFTMKTAEAPAQLLSLTPVQFLFLDADHSYEGTKADWDAWSPYLRDDAEVAFHDSDVEGVRRVLDEIEGWEQVDRIASITVLNRP